MSVHAAVESLGRVARRHLEQVTPTLLFSCAVESVERVSIISRPWRARCARPYRAEAAAHSGGSSGGQGRRRRRSHHLPF